MNLQTIESGMEVDSERSARVVFSATAIFTAHGQVILNADSDLFRPSTRVTASIVEVDNADAPFIGAARMTIHNVRPYQGGVQVWANIEWNTDLRVRISYFWEG
ncbi:hypothetical protein [Actinomadura sp. WMMA1423]|uniref:hypothetical protein n=1 Tax=Actinomadura sp. WMMA1423 TaxID=2591108 RepID=UPI001146FC72|nr:hypothetical protein [Actinomadura sp. WMMA1423]